MFKYGKRVVQIEKWTGGGKSTLPHTYIHIFYNHRVMVNWKPTKPHPWPCRMEAGAGCRIRPWRNTEYVPGRQFAIFIQVTNRGRFCQYISLPMKYRVSGSTLQYKVGLTLSLFLSLDLSRKPHLWGVKWERESCFEGAFTPEIDGAIENYE